MKSWQLYSLLAALALLHPHMAFASPPDLFGFGPRSVGMGMTGTSYSTNWESAYINPANVSADRKYQLAIGLGGGNFRLRINGENIPEDTAGGMVIGFKMPIPFGDILENRLVLAGAFYSPSSYLQLGKIDDAQNPQWPVLSRGQSSVVQVVVGIDLHGVLDGLRVGGGFAVLGNVTGKLTVRLDESNQFSASTETQLLSAFAPVVGISYQKENWALGFAYHGESRTNMKLDVATADLPIKVPLLYVGGLLEYDPHKFTLEGSYVPYQSKELDLRLALGASYRVWSQYPGPYLATSSSSPIGPALEFSDTVSLRFGVEALNKPIQGFEFSLRGGYAYEPSPAKPARIGALRTTDGTPLSTEIPMRMLDNDRHLFSLGVGAKKTFEDGNAFSVDAAMQIHALEGRTHLVPLAGETESIKTSGLVFAGLVSGMIEY